MTAKALVKKERDFSHLAKFQFKPGKSGNPKGGPKKPWGPRAFLKKALKAHGYEAAIQIMKDRGVDIHDGTHGELVVAALLWKGEHGDMDAIKEIFKQVEQPLARHPDDPPDDPDPEGNNINVTVNIIKVSNKIKNIQNNIKKQVVNIKPKKIKLSR